MSGEWSKPKCRGCVYAGKDIPCEYILITGHSPQRDGAHIDPEGRGGCELYTKGSRPRAPRPVVISKKQKKASTFRKLDVAEFLALWGEGKTDAEIAERMDASKRTVRKWRAKRGLAARR